MTDPHRIKIKINGAEFEAEGSSEDVKAQYQAFIDLMKMQPAAAPEPKKNPGDEVPLKETGAGIPGGDSGLSDELLARVFQVSKDGVVSLRVLPKSAQRDADALLLLVYGYKRLKNADNIFGTQLMKAAKFSGIQVDRIDRSFGSNGQYLIRGGRKRSANYTLNNLGISAAEDMVKMIFG